MKNIQDRLDTVINMQEKMYEHLCNSLTIVKNNASFDESNNFDIICINNEDDLNIMEHKLTEDESFKKSMVNISLIIYNIHIYILCSNAILKYNRINSDDIFID